MTFFRLAPALLVCYVAVSLAAVAAEPAKRKVLADFEDAQAVKLTAGEAEATRIAHDGGHVLQITTDAKASWPGVEIAPRQGQWDLTGFDAVELDIRNPQDTSVRILLSVNNPGADGAKNCNVESINVPAGKQATLTVPFGMWHGESNHPLDQAKIVSCRVMLDRAGRSHRFVVDNLRAVTFAEGPATDVLNDPFFKNLKPVFGRGINLGNALDAPKEGEWGVTLKEEYFEAIAKAGFDNVRIPVRWSTHADKAAPYTVDPKFFDRVDWVVKQCLSRKLIPVLNMHHYDELFKEPDQHRARYLGIWKQISERYKDYPAALALELCNEPNSKLTSENWNKMLSECLAIVRRTNPTRQVVIGPVGWNGINDLFSLELPESDRNLVVTVHYYSPHQFTHQGASWSGPEAQKWLGTKWTGTKAEQQAVRRDLDKAIAWAVKHRRPIYLGEFGAYEKADMESRVRWTKFVADEALARKMGFAYWEFCSGFGAYDPAKNAWREPLKNALVK